MSEVTLMGDFLAVCGVTGIKKGSTWHLFNLEHRVAVIEVDCETIDCDVLILEGRIITGEGECDFSINSEMRGYDLLEERPSSMMLDKPYYP